MGAKEPCKIYTCADSAIECPRFTSLISGKECPGGIHCDVFTCCSKGQAKRREETLSCNAYRTGDRAEPRTCAHVDCSDTKGLTQWQRHSQSCQGDTCDVNSCCTNVDEQIIRKELPCTQRPWPFDDMHVPECGCIRKSCQKCLASGRIHWPPAADYRGNRLYYVTNVHYSGGYLQQDDRNLLSDQMGKQMHSAVSAIIPSSTREDCR